MFSHRGLPKIEWEGTRVCVGFSIEYVHPKTTRMGGAKLKWERETERWGQGAGPNHTKKEELSPDTVKVEMLFFRTLKM